MSDRRSLDLSTLRLPAETPYTPMTAIPEPSSKVRRRKSGVVYADRAPEGLGMDQIEEYRRRLARGFYSMPAIQAELARRLLQSGDL